jgi:hypothetical protein
MRQDQRDAFKEAVVDTAIGMAINAPINFVLVALAFQLEWTALSTSLFLTGTFTVLALARKTYIRLYFKKREDESFS